MNDRQTNTGTNRTWLTRRNRRSDARPECWRDATEKSDCAGSSRLPGIADHARPNSQVALTSRGRSASIKKNRTHFPRLIDRSDEDVIMRATRFKMPTPQEPNVFSPEGAIDLHVSPEMRVALREMIDKKPKRLVVDLSRVPYVDSSGLAVLIGAMQSLEHEGGVFMLAGRGGGAPDPGKRAARSIFPPVPTVDEALSAP